MTDATCASGRGSASELVEELVRHRGGGESPEGRVAALDDATDAVYVELAALLDGEVPGLTREEWLSRWADLTETLMDLHKSTERAFEALHDHVTWGDGK